MMKMKLWILITAFILVAGCSKGSVTNKQAAPNQTNTGTQTQSHNMGSMSNMTQASSISTNDAQNSTISMQQASGNGGSWWDWLNLGNLWGGNEQGRTAYPNQPSVQTPYPQQPVQTPYPQQPVQTPSTQPPAQNANPQTSGDASQFPQQVLDLVNQERSKAGLSSLTMNSALSKMAMDKAQDMYNNNYFDHQSPTYGSPFDMMNAYGISYSTAGENIAKGQRSPTEVMNSWMNSQGHRANILNGSFTQIGVAYYNGEWVQVFIG